MKAEAEAEAAREEAKAKAEAEAEAEAEAARAAEKKQKEASQATAPAPAPAAAPKKRPPALPAPVRLSQRGVGPPPAKKAPSKVLDGLIELEEEKEGGGELPLAAPAPRAGCASTHSTRPLFPWRPPWLDVAALSRRMRTETTR